MLSSVAWSVAQLLTRASTKCPLLSVGVPRRQPHCRSGLATLPSVGAVP